MIYWRARLSLFPIFLSASARTSTTRGEYSSYCKYRNTERKSVDVCGLRWTIASAQSEVFKR